MRWIVVLNHAMHDEWPVFRENTVVRLFLALVDVCQQRGRGSITGFIVGEQGLLASRPHPLTRAKKYSGRAQQQENENRDSSVQWYRLVPACRVTRNPVSRAGRLRRGEIQN